MSSPPIQEIEVKFYLANLPQVEQRLQTLGANLSLPRTHETNQLYDTPGRDLAKGRRILRLRQDAAARLTYKGPTDNASGASVRTEIETTIGDFSAAQKLLAALGYNLSWVYEKYRATYALDNVLVTLDELPFGCFLEIEGPDSASLQAAAHRLGLDWDARILDNYQTLFNRLKDTLALNFRDLTFENFTGLSISPTDLGLPAADPA
ncbi:MAG: class IV adenylate cyclase [Anaerolineae bacterium]|nr:class IV adenylate cyclase [Anaerolineae bacterium]